MTSYAWPLRTEQVPKWPGLLSQIDQTCTNKYKMRNIIPIDIGAMKVKIKSIL